MFGCCVQDRLLLGPLTALRPAPCKVPCALLTRLGCSRPQRALPCPSAGVMEFDVPVRMQQWTYEQGYPIVTVGVDQQRRVWLHQARFGLGGILPCDPDASWWIPVRWVAVWLAHLAAGVDSARCMHPGCGPQWAGPLPAQLSIQFLHACHDSAAFCDNWPAAT